MPATDAPAPPDPPAEQRSIDAFDLAHMRKSESARNFLIVKKACDISGATREEIVVCAPDPEKERLRPLRETYSATEGPPRAEWSLGEGATVDLHLDSAKMPDGTVSNRLMAGMKVKF